MFKILKQEITVGDKIQLHLVNGQSPTGIIREIGEEYLLIEESGKITRYFEKLIGGWEVPVNKDLEIIDQEFMLVTLRSLYKSLEPSLLNTIIPANASIFAASDGFFLASNMQQREIIIEKSVVYDDLLLKKLVKFNPNRKIPVWLLYYPDSIERASASLSIRPTTISKLLEKIESSITKKDYSLAKKLVWAFRAVKIKNPLIGHLIHALRPVKIEWNQYGTVGSQPQLQKLPAQIQSQKLPPHLSEDIDACKKLETSINIMIRESKFQLALSAIDKALQNKLPPKYKSSLLLKKAQIFSSLGQPESSEKAYQELIEYNEQSDASPKNLSHLYHELARLQALDRGKTQQAIASVKKALEYNPNNTFAKKLKDQLNEELQDSVFSETVPISKLIAIDIKEHKFTHPEILKNYEKPTAYLAKMILEKAKELSGDIAVKYPIYLEAAKAFNELNPGSYDSKDFYDAVANYSMLKGDSLFSKFKNIILASELDLMKLTRLKDSATSYYLEALNLLPDSDVKLLLRVSANYLKLHLVTYLVANNCPVNINDVFTSSVTETFEFCLSNQNPVIQKIADKAIIDIGSQSGKAWSALITYLPGIIPPKSYDFESNLKQKTDFENEFRSITRLSFEPNNFDQIHSAWFKILQNSFILNDTDLEIKANIEKLVSAIQPYLSRNDNERMHVLLHSKTILEQQIVFINENTTYYGRSFFYGLLINWKKAIDAILSAKLAYDYPNLLIEIDPPYYLNLDAKFIAPVIIRNIGKTTADAYKMVITFKSPRQNLAPLTENFSDTVEVTNEGQIHASIEIPNSFIVDNEAVELNINIAGIYQGNEVNPRAFNFTLESEPKTKLSSEDIPWKDGPVPPEHMFKGRKALIETLKAHYLSEKRKNPYVLYGLTRTGKSSILKYLKKELENSFCDGDRHSKIISFEWDFQHLANSSTDTDFYDALLEEIFAQINVLKSASFYFAEKFHRPEVPKFIDLQTVITQLNQNNLYPFFFIDELSYITTLIDKKIIGSAFLAALREFSLDGKASFIFAGTYDIKKLITDDRYGITGQFVHAIDHQVDRIEDQAAEELIQVVDKQKLVFTPSAINHIKYLSGNIPYFIQIICKACGDYALNKKRRYIGYPELEKVIEILTSTSASPIPEIIQLPEGKFQNNQFSPSAPKEEAALISSIAYFNKYEIVAKGVRIASIEELWEENKMASHGRKIATALESLLTKKIIYEEEDEGSIVYKFSVDLFRRWWYSRHKDIKFEISKLAVDKL